MAAVSSPQPAGDFDVVAPSAKVDSESASSLVGSGPNSLFVKFSEESEYIERQICSAKILAVDSFCREQE